MQEFIPPPPPEIKSSFFLAILTFGFGKLLDISSEFQQKKSELSDKKLSLSEKRLILQFLQKHQQ